MLPSGNTTRKMTENHLFYQTSRVQEYLVIDPDSGRLEGHG